MPLEYRIEFTPDAKEHLKAFTARDLSLLVSAIDVQLSHEPLVETKNRKPMRPNPLAPWELRVGDFRVYYEVYDEPERIVLIVAVGIKVRNLVRIGNRVVQL